MGLERFPVQALHHLIFVSQFHSFHPPHHTMRVNGRTSIKQLVHKAHHRLQTNSATSSTTVIHPPQPALDYQYVVSNRAICAKNLIIRKSHLTSDAIDDVAYLYTESKNLSKKLIDARARQNTLGEKIKAVLIQSRSLKPSQLEDTDQPPLEDHTVTRSGSSGSGSSTGSSSTQWSDLSPSSNLVHAAQVQTFHAEAALLKESITSLTKDAGLLDQRLISLASQLPNSTHPDVRVGPYTNSQVVSTSAGSKLESDSLPFTAFEEPCRRPDGDRDHLKIMTQLDWLSFSDGHKTTGPSFPFLIGPGASLELALSQYALSKAVEAGWKLLIGPDLIRTELSDRCGFSPRDGGEANQTYFVSSTKTLRAIKEVEMNVDHSILPNLCLSATAEIPLMASQHSSTFPNSRYPHFPNQPIKLVSIGNAFRAEAGSRGVESRGLYRVHQFRKVELVSITSAEEDTSEKMLKEMVNLQVDIIEGLNLPYR